MVICKEHCAAGTSVPASIATWQMTIFDLTAGAAKTDDRCVEASSGTDVPRRHISLHSVILAASGHHMIHVLPPGVY